MKIYSRNPLKMLWPGSETREVPIEDPGPNVVIMMDPVQARRGLVVQAIARTEKDGAFAIVQNISHAIQTVEPNTMLGVACRLTPIKDPNKKAAA